VNVTDINDYLKDSHSSASLELREIILFVVTQMLSFLHLPLNDLSCAYVFPEALKEMSRRIERLCMRLPKTETLGQNPTYLNTQYSVL
jgi:hypothetical protein